MTTLKSSVGTKSSNLLLDDADRLSFYHHERASALGSSWINRLHLRLPHVLPRTPQQPLETTTWPSAAASGLAQSRSISADEGRTSSVAGFGSFRFRARKTLRHRDGVPVDHARHVGFPFLRGFAAVAGGGDRKMILKSFTAEENKDRDRGRSFMQVRNTLPSVFFRLHPSPTTGRAAIDKGKRIVDLGPTTSSPSSPSRDSSRIRPSHFGNGRSPAPLPQIIPPELVSRKRLRKELWGSDSGGTSTRNVSRSRDGGIFHDTIDDTVQFSPFGNPQRLHHKSVQHHPERQNPALHCELEKTFSYWNMGRFKRKNTISTHVALSGNFYMKSNFNADGSFPSKFGKLGSKN